MAHAYTPFPWLFLLLSSAELILHILSAQCAPDPSPSLLPLDDAMFSLLVFEYTFSILVIFPHQEFRLSYDISR